MNQQESFEQLKNAFDLNEADFYFLDLIPLIEMIWADGINQEGELKLLYKFVIEHIAALDQKVHKYCISVADANSFLDRFAHKKPDTRLMKELMRIFLSTNCGVVQKHQTILEYCIDIAAACTTQYPFEMQQRIMQKEKQLLTKLFQELKIPPDLKQLPKQ